MATSLSTSRSTAGIASVVVGLWILGACSSDSKPGVSADAGSGGKGGTGNRSTIGGRTGSGGGLSGGGTNADAAASCSLAVSVTCDGPEDCPTGQRCCGEWDQVQASSGPSGQYLRFGCFASCTAQQAEAGGGAMWFDLCHPGDVCEVAGISCLTSPYLPGSLSRCYTDGTAPDAKYKSGKGEVNCGTAVCGAGEQCCMRGATLAPYCAPSGATCDCTLPKPATDGGKPTEAGPDANVSTDGAAPTDAKAGD